MSKDLTLFKNEQERENAKSSLADFSNPFNSNSVKQILMWIRKSPWAPYDIEYSATIEFKSGSTSGKQEIVAENFPQLVQKVEAFVKNL
jgi:hypothetical protein